MFKVTEEIKFNLKTSGDARKEINADLEAQIKDVNLVY